MNADRPSAAAVPGSASQHPTAVLGRWPVLPKRLRSHGLLVPALLALAGVLAVTSLVTDSITFDETSHLTAGMSYLLTGDFRLAPDHPPLGKVWAALPLLLLKPRWVQADDEQWVVASVAGTGQRWLFELNDGQRLVVIGRCAMVILLLGTCLATYALGRTLFGPPAGLLALTLAALDPTMLAHGRLVTTDMPVTLCMILTLLAFAWLMERTTWPRLLAAAAALAAAALAKLSWPLVLPALLAMAAFAVIRPASAAGGTASPKAVAAAAAGGPTASVRLSDRVAAKLGILLCLGLTTWVGIWTGYGWRTSMVPALPPGASDAAIAERARTLDALTDQWRIALEYEDGRPRPGLVPAALRFVARTGLLPEAYQVGLSMALCSTERRNAYLVGEYSLTGWWTYFPIAFAIKTPLATQLLLLAGIAALLARRVRNRQTVLLVGTVVFAAGYAIYAMAGSLNIGHRHLLPLYPALFALAGASAAWLTTRIGRWLVGAALVWLMGASLWIHPHYLSYFNELVGGPSRGHLYLADSNIDWGQDLLRLAEYARQHPDETIKLAYFGSATPQFYVACTALPSYFAFGPPASLTRGTYVVSVTQLLGVCDPEIRDRFWTNEHRRGYERLQKMAAAIPAADEPDEEVARRREATLEYNDLRSRRLLCRLRHRPPDERIGHTLFVYRLKDADIERLTRP